MNCPRCATTLNRMNAPAAFAVVPTPLGEKTLIATVYACPACEFVGTKDAICGHCGGEKPMGQSCGCFDNRSQ